MNQDFKLNSIEEAIEDFKAGKFVIVVDDEDRENEGDFITAAELITPEKVNFMMRVVYSVRLSPKSVQPSSNSICRCMRIHRYTRPPSP